MTCAHESDCISPAVPGAQPGSPQAQPVTNICLEETFDVFGTTYSMGKTCQPQASISPSAPPREGSSDGDSSDSGSPNGDSVRDEGLRTINTMGLLANSTAHDAHGHASLKSDGAEGHPVQNLSTGRKWA